MTKHKLFPLLWSVLAVIIALPAVVQFMGNATERLNVMAQPPDPFLREMFEVFRSFGGTNAYVVVIGVALVIVAICVLRRRLNWRYGVILLAWVSVPALVYVVKDNREFLNVRYMWWVVIGIVMLIGAATIYFPRIAQMGSHPVTVGTDLRSRRLVIIQSRAN